MEGQCTVGIRSESKCNLKTYSGIVGVQSVFEIEPDIRETMLWKSGLTILNINATVCWHHKYILLNHDATQQKICCNPFGLHKSVCRGRIIIIFFHA